MELDNLIEIVRRHNPSADLDMIKLAYDFTKEAFGGQKRLTGEPAFNHSVNTAFNLAKLKMDPLIVAAGLLHDVPEDTSVSLEEVKKNFGKEIAKLVEGITKVGKVKYRGLERYIENLRKMFIAMAEDIRVIIIKFADRLDNLQTLEIHPPVKQLRIARETIEIYAPIAHRLGMGELKGQLEDSAFPFAYPQEYHWVQEITKGQLRKKEKILKEAIKIVEKNLEEMHIKYLSVHGRTKHLFSLYKKLLRYDKDINRIYDLVALRIIVENVSDCYAVLGLIHKRWRPLKGRIKDYIAQPKPNGYQSLHTTVFTDSGDILEAQIRSQEMHEEAELGIAAHWSYDDKKGSRDYIARKPAFASKKELSWVNQLKKWRKDLEENKEYLDNLKIEVFQNRIFVFTPKGDVIDLPELATPIDFAYHVHTEIGNKATGALVNDQMAPLDKPLKSGDVIEVITDRHRQSPNPDWLDFVKTHVAKSKIKQATKSKRGLLRWLPPLGK